MGHVFSDHPDSVVELVDGVNVAIDASLGKIFTLTKAVNGTLDNPTNLRPGMEFMVKVTQDGTGNRTLAYGSLYKFPGNTHTLSTGAADVDVIKCIFDGTDILCTIHLDFL